MIVAPPPGLHTGVSHDDYHAWDALRSSTLKLYRDLPPAKVLEKMQHPDPPKKDQELGTAWHAALLEPDIFEARYVATPDVKRQGVGNLKLWAEFEANLAPDQQGMKPKMLDTVRRMRDAAYRDPLVRALLTGPGLNETAATWEHPVHGFLCSLKFDRLVQRGASVLLDLKKTRNASRKAFGADVDKYSYHLSAAWYLEGLNQVDVLLGRRPKHREFAWLAQEDTAPYLCAVWWIDPEDLADGQAECERLAALHAHCTRNNDWPGYTPGQPQVVSRPPWAKRRPDPEEIVPPHDDEDEEEALFGTQEG